VIVHAHQFGPLILPKGFNVSFGKTTKELEPPGKELSFEWIIKIAISTLAGVRLLEMVDGKCLVLDIDDSTNFARALVKYLSSKRYER
jgi:hypothetical protein